MNVGFTLFSLLTLAVLATILYARHGTAMPNVKETIVVELFTSQGCSSCPPADAILTELSEKNNVIALGFHVSYWNHLNWKDTLSHEYADLRQHGYVSNRGERSVYTPQMIVNGLHAFVGSHRNKVESALMKAEKSPIQSIKIQQEDDNTIVFELPQAVSGNYRLWAYGYKRKVNQSISRGENRGRSIPYAMPVVSYTNLGGWQGQALEQRFEKPESPLNLPLDGIAILVQKNGYGEIIAAGKFEF